MQSPFNLDPEAYACPVNVNLSLTEIAFIASAVEASGLNESPDLAAISNDLGLKLRAAVSDRHVREAVALAASCN